MKLPFPYLHFLSLPFSIRDNFPSLISVLLSFPYYFGQLSSRPPQHSPNLQLLALQEAGKFGEGLAALLQGEGCRVGCRRR